MLTNPALNYAQFLLRAILPTVLHIVIAIIGGLCRRLGVRLGADMQRMARHGGRRSADGAGRQARRPTSASSSSCWCVEALHHPWRLSRCRSAAIRSSPGAAGCLFVAAYLVARRAVPAPGAQPRLRPDADRHHLLARLRLRRRRLPGAGDGRVRPRCGAPSCRCAGTSRSCSTRRRAACPPQDSVEPFVACLPCWPWSFFGLAAASAALDRRTDLCRREPAAEARDDARPAASSAPSSPSIAACCANAAPSA